jgi:hypothetical protein
MHYMDCDVVLLFFFIFSSSRRVSSPSSNPMMHALFPLTSQGHHFMRL